MAAKRGRVEIIEVLPEESARPEHTGYGPPPAVTVPTGRRRPRWWIAPVAVGGIAAVVIGAGVFSDSSSDGPARRASSESELAGRATMNPDVLPLVPATPAGYRIVGAAQTPGEPADGERPVRQLWSTSAKGAALGSWVEITAARSELPDDLAGDRRVEVPGGVAVLDTERNGNIRIAGPIAGGGTAILASSGVSRATLVELLSSLRFIGEALHSTDDRLGGMFRSIAVDDGAPAATGATLTVAYDAVPTEPTQPGDAPVTDARSRQPDGFTVTVGSLGAPYDEAARQFFLSRREQVTVNAQQAVVGFDDRRFGTQSLSFERAGLRIGIAGTAPRPVLLAAAQTTHVATGDELAALFGAGALPSPATADSSTTVRLAGGQLAGGSAYAISIDPVVGTDGTVRILLSADGVTRVASVTPHDSYVATVASPSMTALVAFVPATAGDAQLVVDIGDPASPTTFTAASLDLPGGLRVAAIAFDQMQPYTAAIHTADGATLSAVSG